MPSLTIDQDESKGIVTINGIRYAAVLFDNAAWGPVGSFMRIEARNDGTITMRGFSKDLEEKFITIAGLKPIGS